MFLRRRAKRQLCQVACGIGLAMFLIYINYFRTTASSSSSSEMKVSLPVEPKVPDQPGIQPEEREIALPPRAEGDQNHQEGAAEAAPPQQVNHASVFPPAFLPKEIPPKEDESSVNSLGYGGKPVEVDEKELSPEELTEFKAGWKNNEFSQFVSDRISVRRYLPDDRDEKCKTLQKEYESDKSAIMSKTSIIICFHNEAWTTLLRSVHSVFDRSPENLVEELILVDDASLRDYLKKPLDDYMAQFNGKVKVLHLEERAGLIRARMKGAEIAKAPVLTFLDSHIECLHGWLEPLLHEIAVDNKTVIAPVITTIKDDTFHVKPSKLEHVQVGGFDWNLIFNWHFPPKREQTRPGAPYSPLKTPTIAGGLFSISRSFFEELGWYDPEFEVWGAENLEISFKAWMCHGRLLISPCGQVGHIFREHSPYKWDSAHTNPLGWNNARLANTILGDYKKYYLNMRKKRDFGDISARVAILERLKCHDFTWYLENIYPEQFDPSKALHYGRIRNPDSDLCLDANENKDQTVGIYRCHKAGGNQVWFYSDKNEIRRDSKCFDSNSNIPKVGLYSCHGQEGAQLLSYSEKQKFILSNGGKCIALDEDKKGVQFTECRYGSSEQTWVWDDNFVD